MWGPLRRVTRPLYVTVGTVGGVKVDADIGTDLASVARIAKTVEDAGYAGAWTTETSHDPFMPLLLAAEHTDSLEIGHIDRRRVRTVADDPGPHRMGSAGLLDRPFRARPREPDQAAHREAILDGVVRAGGAHARVRARNASDLAHVADRRQTRVPRRVLQAHVDDTVLSRRAETDSATSAPRRSTSPASAR